MAKRTYVDVDIKVRVYLPYDHTIAQEDVEWPECLEFVSDELAEQMVAAARKHDRVLEINLADVDVIEFGDA